MTVEELNSLKPSYDNQITLECDDGEYSAHLKIIKVVTPVVKDAFSVLDRDGDLRILYTPNLHHFPSLKPETEKKRWFELWVTGSDKQVFKFDVIVDSSFKDFNGYEVYPHWRKALGREVTDEIEKLEWK